MSDLRWCDAGNHQYGAGDKNALRMTISTIRGNDQNTYESVTQDMCGECAIKGGFVKDDSKVKAIAGVLMPKPAHAPATKNRQGKYTVDAETYEGYLKYLEREDGLD